MEQITGTNPFPMVPDGYKVTVRQSERSGNQVVTYFGPPPFGGTTSLAVAPLSAHVENWTWSPFTGRYVPVGREGAYLTYAAEHEDGTWSWHGFIFVSLDAVKASARAGGY